MAAPNDEEGAERAEGAEGPRYGPGVAEGGGGRLRGREEPRDFVVWVLGGVRAGRCVPRSRGAAGLRRGGLWSHVLPDFGEPWHPVSQIWEIHESLCPRFWGTVGSRVSTLFLSLCPARQLI